MDTKVSFPQPEVEAPEVGATYYATTSSGEVTGDGWGGGSFDRGRLSAGNIYLTRAEAEQRAAWNRQDMARRVVPKWFRDLGPDVELLYQSTGKWTPVDVADITDWSNRKPEHYRAKPKPAPDVVVTVNGREYRWPAPVEQGEERGDRFLVAIDISGKFHKVLAYSNVLSAYGPRTHHTREGAEAQCAALNAALGITKAVQHD